MAKAKTEEAPVAPAKKRSGVRQWQVTENCFEAWGEKGTDVRKYFRAGTRFQAPAWWEPTPAKDGVVRHMYELTPEVLAQEEAARIEAEQENMMGMGDGNAGTPMHRRGVVRGPEGDTVVTSGGIR